MNVDNDIFISYRRSDAEDFSANLADRLRWSGYSVFFDHDNLKGGNFRHNIEAAIDACTDFIVVLSKDTFSDRIQNEDDPMRMEIARALRMKKNIVCVAMRSWPDAFPDKLPPELDQIRWMNYLPCENTAAREQNFKKLTHSHDYLKSNPHADSHAAKDAKPSRHSSAYWKKNSDRLFEEDLLGEQEAVLRKFDNDVYDDLLAGASDLAVLDIGCGNGLTLMKRLGNRPEVTHILGVDSDPDSIRAAREQYPSTAECQVDFEVMDCEADDFIPRLKDYLRRNNLSGFDFVNISMTLLFLRDPRKMLDGIRSALSDGAQFFVRDIDDGLDIAYPDEKGDFAHLNQLVGRILATGFRTSGRQLFSVFYRAGYSNIRLRKAGLSTVGMGYADKHRLFKSSFGWAREELEAAQKSDRSKEDLDQDLIWYDDNIDRLQMEFQGPDFFYQEGHVIYTARYVSDPSDDY